jgi:hypothetical protein
MEGAECVSNKTKTERKGGFLGPFAVSCAVYKGTLDHRFYSKCSYWIIKQALLMLKGS